MERQLFQVFADKRVRPNREFFTADPEAVVAAIRIADHEDVTPRTDVVQNEDDSRALNQARKRRTNFDFHMVGIQPGTVLVFTRSDAITCTVVDKKNVNFRGEIMSLSAAAQKAMSELGYSWSAVQGPAMWQFENMTLDEIRTMAEMTA